MDFVKRRGWFYLLSLLVILPGIVSLVTTPGLRPGIDFIGGSTLTLRFADDVDQARVRATLADLGHPAATVQKLGGDTYFVRTKALDEAAKEALVEGMKGALSPDGVEVLSFDLVSPVVARETVIAAMWAVLAATVGIFFYVWWAFRNVPSPFRYGAAAIVALLHDTLVILGVFSILGRLAGMEVNTMFLVALLTVIGYSVNDTIVIFDRLRENVIMHPNRPFEDNVNLSISESLSRSLNTSLTLLFVLLAMFLFGGTTIREFLLVLLIGVVAGTYSSVGIAAQLLVSWDKGDLGRLVRRFRPAPSPG